MLQIFAKLIHGSDRLFICLWGAIFFLTLTAIPNVDARALSQEQNCPGELKSAYRLIVVLAPTMSSPSAKMRLYERAHLSELWSQIGVPQNVVLGQNGLGWAWDSKSLAIEKDPIKREGDRKTPAGVFSIGRAFGFDGKTDPHYLRLQYGKTICVDDLTSPYYNQIVSRAVAGKKTKAEEMRAISLYRHGLVINHPTNREAKGGSCIFIHIWRFPTKGTAGCIATSAKNVKILQAWIRGRKTAIAILPEEALGRLHSCLPQRAIAKRPPK